MVSVRKALLGIQCLVLSLLIMCTPLFGFVKPAAAADVSALEQIRSFIPNADDFQRVYNAASTAHNGYDCAREIVDLVQSRYTRWQVNMLIDCAGTTDNINTILWGLDQDFSRTSTSGALPAPVLGPNFDPSPTAGGSAELSDPLAPIYASVTAAKASPLIQAISTGKSMRDCGRSVRALMQFISVEARVALVPVVNVAGGVVTAGWAIQTFFACGDSIRSVATVVHSVMSDSQHRLPTGKPYCPSGLLAPFLPVVASINCLHNQPNGTTVANVQTTPSTGGSTPTPPPVCVPGPGQVAFFVEPNYMSNTCVVKGVGTYNDPASIGLPNDSISSIKLGDNVKARVCNNAGMNSPCEDMVQNDAMLSDNTIGDNTISSAQVQPRGGVQLCSDANYGGTCRWFESTTINDLATIGLNGSISSIKVPSNFTLFLYDGLNLAGTPGVFNTDTADLTAHTWNDRARSLKIEPRLDTSCNETVGPNGVLLYRDPEFRTGGGCKLVTGDVRDLGYTFPRLTGLKFVGDYRFNYKVTIYRNTDHTNVCGVYTLDQSDLRECASVGLSLKVEPYSPPPQATNYAPLALRDSPSTQAVVDDSLSTEWIGGHKKPLGFVFDSPKEIKTVTIFDRTQSGSDNNQINKAKLVFSDGTVINDIDMTSGGPRCAEVTFPAKTVGWVNVVPDDASGNNGFREVHIWGASGSVYANSNCVMKFNLTATSGTGPAPTATWPTVTPPNATAATPANNATFPAATTTVRLDYATGESFRMHVWGTNYDSLSGWSTATHTNLTDLTGGIYYWQVQSKNSAGEGAWSAVRQFTINTPPVLVSGQLTIHSGTPQSIRVEAFDAEQQNAVTLTANGLPSFATFTNNGGGVGTLQLNPSAAQTGIFTITVTASDGEVSANTQIWVKVTSGPTANDYQAVYFNNRTLSGTPVLTRSEAAIDNDWDGGSPGSGVAVDNFSARWTRTIDFAAGTYRFTATGDDGIRLFIDDQLVLDKWIDQGSTTYNVDKTLAAGNHTVKYEYYESGGGAVAKLSYQQVTAPNPTYSFYKGVNFNGNAATIEGNTWQSMSAALSAGLSLPSGYQTANTSLTPNPATDSDTSAILNSAVWKPNAALTANQTVANGDYHVYLWVMENYQTNIRKMNVKLEGTQVAADVGYLSKNSWVKYGPYSTTVADGALSMELVNALDSPHVMGMAIYQKNGSTPPPPPPSPTPNITSGNTYKLINPNSGKALDVYGGIAADGTNVHIWTDTGGDPQKWRITQNTDGTYKLLNPVTNRALDVNGAGTTDGTNVHIWTDNGSNAQKWRITQHADGTYKLVSPNSNKALDVNGGGTANGTNVHIWSDNGSAAQKWQIIDVTSAAPPPVLTFTGSGTVTPSSAVAGNTITLNSSFTSTSASNSTTRIHLEIRNPSDQQVYSRDFDNETFTPGQTKNYTTTWTVPQGSATGSYVVKGGAVSADGGTWHLWSNNLGTFIVSAPTPPAGTELLTAPWNLVGNNGASEKYQSIAANSLAGKTTLRVTYDLHGINALGGDASAIIFDQNGWKFVSLASYGQNGLNGPQTVDIPLGAFGLDLSQSVGTLHTRFWYGAPFTVDITSIRVF